ncbi:MAG: SpoIIE family protein phosphatase [Bacteroidales bacterium]|nr:SpoIIE family protein phosphatase [Bacteroidales bacterium]
MEPKGQMEQKSVPNYYGLRLYLASTFLYFFLVIPFLFFIAFQSIPQLAANKNISRNNIPSLDEEYVDSIVNKAITLDEEYVDSIADGKLKAGVQISGTGPDDQVEVFEEKGPFSKYFRLLFLLLFLSYVAGLAYNIRFKRYFKLKRKKREISERLHAFCKRNLLATPLVNSMILTIPNVVVIVYSLIFIYAQNRVEGEIEKDLFIQFFYLTLVATLLEFLFVYYWQKHRVHIKYIDHIYSGTELRKQVFSRKGGKIRNRFLIASGMTTFLPLVIVLVYLILSLTAIKELDLDSFSPEQKEVLIGPWINILDPEKENFEKLFYVNAIDSIIMLVGIGNGIMVSFIYLLLFIKWTNQDITGPLKELLRNIRNTRGGEVENYTIVRTNDEIGELAEGYNEMTKKIHDYVESISKMNRELEERVKERTNEVVMQKEEIEAQKEEIEAQLDMATLQRDTISQQNEQILDSIHYAERIQSAILPPVDYLSDYLTDHFILFKPRDIVSGDYYWTTRQDEKLIIAVADCTGHGVPGAFVSMLGISFLNEIVNRSESIQANQILEQLRDFVIKSLHQTGSKGETQDGIEIALCVIDTHQNVLEYSGANRPVYIIRKGASAGTNKEGSCEYTLMHINPDKMPIGIYEQETKPFTNNEIQLKKNDSIYLFSDGYVDQIGGPARKTFRSKYFKELLLDIQDKPMEAQKSVLIEKLEAWQGSVEQIDDILVVGIKI